MKKRISKIGVLQSGKICGVIYAGFAVVMLPFFLLGAMANPKGLIPMIIMLFFYPVMGFVGGIIGAFIFNLAAKFVGGLEFEVETVEE